MDESRQAETRLPTLNVQVEGGERGEGGVEKVCEKVGSFIVGAEGWEAERRRRRRTGTCREALET